MICAPASGGVPSAAMRSRLERRIDMRWRIRHILGVVAFVVVLLVVTWMWVRSHRVADAIGYGAKYTRGEDGAYMIRFASVRSSRGVVYFGAGRFLEMYLRASSVREGLYTEHDVPPPPESRSQWAMWGFRYSHVNAGGGAFVVRSVGIPYWFITFNLAWGCALMVRRFRSVRRAPSACAHCGYDLRGSSERCPECGTPFSSDARGSSTAAGRD